MQNLHVLKTGGNVIDHDAGLRQFLAGLAQVEGPLILVHGGGSAATRLAERLGVEQKMVDGRRITDAATLELITMVYAGLLNKTIVALLGSYGIRAIGLSGADNNCIRATQRAGGQYGFVGDIAPDGVNVKFITSLLDQGIVPVFCPVTHDNAGQLLNTNADTVAAAVATALAPHFAVHLRYYADVQGVLSDVADPATLLRTLTRHEYVNLRREGIVSKGMIPKLDTAFAALDNGVRTVAIAAAADMPLTINGEHNAGTHLVATDTPAARIG